MTLTVTPHEHEWVYVGETELGLMFECAHDFCTQLRFGDEL